MEINNQTQWFGVIGNPVEHSLSPAIHNAAFQKTGVNGVYLALRVESIGDAIKGLRTLGIRPRIERDDSPQSGRHPVSR
ncbi:MAG: hypothetical protein U0361_12380 [Nitrospiraceae bacterium]